MLCEVHRLTVVLGCISTLALHILNSLCTQLYSRSIYEALYQWYNPTTAHPWEVSCGALPIPIQDLAHRAVSSSSLLSHDMNTPY